jgi:hypothetical protein
MKATQEHFKTYFRTKHIDITRDSLQTVVSATRSGQLGSLVQHLVLVGVVYNTEALEWKLREHNSGEDSAGEMGFRFISEEAKRNLEILKQRRMDYEQLHTSGIDVVLLSEAFSNIIANSNTRKLLSLSLEVVVYRDDIEHRLAPLDGGM